MQQNSQKLSALVNDWEASQIGLSERSEKVWDKLESALENKNKKKNHLPFLFAAASILILAVSGFYFLKNDLSNQTIARKNKTITIRKSSLETISSEPQLIEKIIVQKKKSTTLFEESNQPLSSLVSEDVDYRDTNTYNQKIIEVNNIARLEPVIATPKSENVHQEIEKPNYWKQYKTSSKIKFGYPIVHINDLNLHDKTNTTILTVEEKTLPNFEIIPPNDVKHKWKITLQPNTSPFSLSHKE